jgi:hypothetical protein
MLTSGSGVAAGGFAGQTKRSISCAYDAVCGFSKLVAAAAFTATENPKPEVTKLHLEVMIKCCTWALG